MGAAVSSEHRGVHCGNCEIGLPANNFKFDKSHGLYIFFDETSDGMKTLKYIRREGINSYQCLDCVQDSDPGLFDEIRLFA
jgi:hypothetical protein